ncbi:MULTISPECIES: lantibiotic dehydratase C-terminal domain-containing protein [Actinosynnema]|uniref:lantibiotic dehydratase C-terminal domain-containing protein n=1 Tax=Actinosynnema TaxID=40566 RepID=UPI0020A525AE|nr:lantibiotic dehydratase C-terminal domain-containing protein [Actinosynnema pretiosum]MCP2098131.1 Lantibiotic biosynthesis dehydratase C-term [Actinosynnema pretiosum]
MIDVVCHYRDPVKAPLLRTAVLPALAAATDAGAVGHLERHWLGGPHVRVRLDGPPETINQSATLVADRLRAHLTDHPSTVDTTDAELLERSRQSGIAELIPPPYEPIHPDNTVLVEPTDLTSILRLTGSTELVELRTRCLRLGVPAITDAVSTDRTSQGRAQLALIAMAAHASRFPAGIANGYHSFLSHLEGFLAHSDPNGALRTRFDALWERNADAAEETVRSVLDGSLGTVWARWSDATRELGEAAFDRGELPTGPTDLLGERALELGEPDALRRWHRDHLDAPGEYHRRLIEVDFDHPDYLRPVTVYRNGTNALYRLLAVCDVTPVERYLAASLLVRAVQRVTGVAWDEQVARMAKAAR